MPTEFQLELDGNNCHQTFEDKMDEFKKNPEKMQEVNNFVDDVLTNAKCEADKKLVQTKDKELRGRHSLINGFKRGRILTRARSAVVRIFEAICNCSTSSTPQMSVASKAAE